MTRAGAGSGRLPLHPRPLPHEALSSWLDRLAAAYGLKRDRFIRSALGADPAPCVAELDAGGSLPSLSAALAERTGVPPGRIRVMTFAGYVPELIAQAQLGSGMFGAYIGPFRWFVAQGRTNGPYPEPAGPWTPWRADDLLSDMPRCCPRCLVADAIPYVRLHWRLAWMASCPLHGETLVPLPSPFWMVQCMRERSPDRAAPDLLALDRITLGAATTGTAILPRGGSQVPGGAWLRALRALRDELAQPFVWPAHPWRDELTRAWLRTGRMPVMRHCGREATFERLPPERRSALLQVAGAAVRHQAVHPARGGEGTRLRASVTQWSADGFCGA